MTASASVPDLSTPPRMPPFGVIELRRRKPLSPEAFEFHAIAACLRSVDGIALAPALTVRLSRDDIHVLDRADYDATTGARGTDGVCIGHEVYVVRTADRVSLVARLTHEIAHAVSFKRTSQGPGGPMYWTGFAWQCSTFSGTKTRFEGFNEAATELFATEMRKNIACSSNLLDQKERHVLMHYMAYRRHVRLVETLGRLISNDWDDDEWKRMLFDGYLRGTQGFLTSVRDVLPAAYVELFHATTSPHHAMAIAAKLRLLDLVREFVTD